MSIRAIVCLFLSLIDAGWSEPVEVKVLSWNVHGGREGAPEVVRVLRQSGAELFLLQEFVLPREGAVAPLWGSSESYKDDPFTAAGN